MITINNIKDLEQYYNKDQNAYIFEDDVTVTKQGLTFDSDIKAKTFKIGEGHKDSWLRANDMEFENLEAEGVYVYAKNFKAKEVNAYWVNANVFRAEEATVTFLEARDVKAGAVKSNYIECKDIEVEEKLEADIIKAKLAIVPNDNKVKELGAEYVITQKKQQLDATFTGLKEDKETGIER